MTKDVLYLNYIKQDLQRKDVNVTLSFMLTVSSRNLYFKKHIQTQANTGKSLAWIQLATC